MVTSLKSSSSTIGFTLIEVLLSAAVGVVILGVITSYWVNTLNVTAVAVVSRTALEDLRSSGNYMADMVNQASYVFPPNAKITLASTSSAYTVNNPNTGTSVWTVGTDPIVAMLVPPLDGTASCDANTNTFATTRGCIKFMAFYAVKRSVVMAAATGAERPNVDPRVPNAWTVYQYVRNLVPVISTDRPDGMLNLLTSLRAAGTLVNYTASQPTGGNSGNLLADYIAPNGFSASISQCFLSASNVTQTLCPATQSEAIYSALSVNLSLRGQIPRSGNSLMNIPSTPLEYRSAPRNLLNPLN